VNIVESPCSGQFLLCFSRKLIIDKNHIIDKKTARDGHFRISNP